jgi:hypothetical protein
MAARDLRALQEDRLAGQLPGLDRAGGSEQELRPYQTWTADDCQPVHEVIRPRRRRKPPRERQPHDRPAPGADQGLIQQILGHFDPAAAGAGHDH